MKSENVYNKNLYMLWLTSQLTLRESSLIYGSNVSEIGDITGESKRKKFSFKHAHHHIYSNIFSNIFDV